MSEGQVAEAIRDATGPLWLAGGGTRLHGDGARLDLSGLSGIELYEPGALTLVARAGTPLAEVEAALAASNQRLAFEPPDLRGLTGHSGTPTLGGAVATNASGPRRVVAGACRDHLLGLRFVDGTGTTISNGGRVMKNVTGYDLVKLLCGSWGSLGAITQVSLKVLPQVEAQATLTLRDLTDAQAVAAMSDALTSPFEVTGAAHDPTDGATRLRIEGFEASVAYRAQRLSDRLSRHGEVTVETDTDAVRATWAAIRDVAPFHDRPGDVWRIHVAPSAAPDLALGDLPRLYDWGGGLVWVLTPEGHDLRGALGAFDGHATLVRGTGHGPRAHPTPPGVRALEDGLRARFDPRGILNPGVMTA
ncbi:MAG: FAD-binding protein [Paracoccaceae bacterium]